jgi:phosphatidylinositol glycan class N
MSFFLGFSVCFVVLSISIEGLFYSAFTFNLLLWIDVEVAVRKTLGVNGSMPKQVQTDSYRFQADDARIALFFLFFVQVAFFGTGKYVTFLLRLPVYFVLICFIFSVASIS